MLGRENRVSRVRVRYRRDDGEFVDTTMAAGLPVREFRCYSGWYWSATLQRLVVYDSRLKLARIQLADFDEDVVCVAAQPFQFGVAAGPVSIAAIEWALRGQCPPVLVRPVVLHLPWKGVLRADLTRPLSLETEVRSGRQVTR